MAEVKLPELGENIEKGDVVRVLVNVGDVIKPDQPIVELETDKATIEVPTSVGGTIAEIRVKAGDKVKVGQVMLVVNEGAAAETVAAEAKPAPEAKPAAAAEPARPTEAPAAPAGQAAPVAEAPAPEA